MAKMFLSLQGLILIVIKKNDTKGIQNKMVKNGFHLL